VPSEDTADAIDLNIPNSEPLKRNTTVAGLMNAIDLNILNSEPLI
jgi:hypothetical protein